MRPPGQAGPDPAVEALRRRLCAGRHAAVGSEEDRVRWRGATAPQGRLVLDIIIIINVIIIIEIIIIVIIIIISIIIITIIIIKIIVIIINIIIIIIIIVVELAMIMDRLYGGVCYAGIDTDPELKYPKVLNCSTYGVRKIFDSEVKI